ncbi:MAG: hypothetical protein AB8H80_22100 [Planctomycetota bacterium]
MDRVGDAAASRIGARAVRRDGAVDQAPGAAPRIQRNGWPAAATSVEAAGRAEAAQRAAKTATQSPGSSKPAKASATGAGKESLSPVKFLNNGWPVLAGDTPVPTPLVETKSGVKRPVIDSAASLLATPAPPAARRIASGMDLDSPMHEVFRATATPGAMQRLGGVVVWWRMTVHGTHGETIGMRELTHIADVRFADRDRLEYVDGRRFGRLGELVGAQRSGIPYDNLLPDARADLELFGMHIRMPWCYGDGKRYTILAREVVSRRSEKLVRLRIDRRPPIGDEVFGPPPTSKPGDRFQLLYDPTTGLPRELVHRFAASGQERRVLLEDWRELRGIVMPFRRVYVDDAMRPTTTLEILRIQQKRTSERDFRLL